MLNYDWSKKMVDTDDEYRREDILAIKNLMNVRFSPRNSYFKTNCRRRLTFEFENIFGIYPNKTWVQVMRTNFATWCSDNSNMVVMPSKVRPCLAKIRGHSPEYDEVITEKPKDKVEPEYLPSYNLFKISETDQTDAKYEPNIEKKHLHEFQMRLWNSSIMMNNEQLRFIRRIRDEVAAMSDLDLHQVKYFLLTGHAGCGKTSTLNCIQHLPFVKVMYLAITQRLCAAARKNYGINATTFCRFMMYALDMKPIAVMTLLEAISYLSTDEIITHSFNSIKTETLELLFMKHSPNVNVIFLDEISMFSPPMLEVFIAIVRRISQVMDLKIIVILTGDFMQISPLFTHSMKYDSIVNACECVFNFKGQHRITDLPYLETVMKLTKQPLPDAKNFLHQLRQVTPREAWCNKITYIYPFEKITNAYEKYKQHKCPYMWKRELDDDFFDSLLDFNMFCFSNREMHYNNLSLAFCIVSQFVERKATVDQLVPFICFSTFCETKQVIDWPIKINDDYVIPVLPLIRYFPYRFVGESDPGQPIPSKSIVYLIDWNFERYFIVVYVPLLEKFVFVPFGKFNMNMCNEELCGIPLEFAFSTTFHSSQGLTLSSKIALSLDNIDFRELFVMLTRVHSGNQIKNIYVN